MVTQQDIIEFQINEARRKLAAVHTRSKGKITAAGRQAQAELSRLLSAAQQGSRLSAQGLKTTYAAERAGGRQENASLAADLARQGGNTSALAAMAAQQDAALGAQGNRTGAYQSDLDTLMSGIAADRDRGMADTTAATQQELDANLAEQQAALDAQRTLAMMQLAAQGGGGGGRGGGGRRGGGGGGGSSGAVKPLTASEMRQLNEAFTSSQMKAPDLDKLAQQYVYDPLDKSLSADPALASLAGTDVAQGLAPGQSKDIAREVAAQRLRADEQRNMNDVMRRIAAGDKPEDIVRGWNITEARDKPQWNVGDVDTFLENWQRQRGAYDTWASTAPTRGEFMQARIAEYYANQGVDVTDEELHPTEHRLWKAAGTKFLADKEAKRRADALAKANAPKIAAAKRMKDEMNYQHNIGIMSMLKPDALRNLGQTGILDFSKSGLKPPGLLTTLESYGSGERPTVPTIQMPKPPRTFVLPPGASNTLGPMPAPPSERPDISHAAPPPNFADILNWYAAKDRGIQGAAAERRRYAMGRGRGI